MSRKAEADGCSRVKEVLARVLEDRAQKLWGPLVAGVDEAGRGPLAGPLIVAAVILPRDLRLAAELDDSKRIPPRRRAKLAFEIRQQAVAWSVVRVSARTIDRIGVAGAVDRGMAGAVGRLRPAPCGVLFDGSRVPPGLGVPGRAVVDGDRLAAAIMAASILAKTARDREMDRWDRIFPGYGFARHRGYGTALHYARLIELGPSPVHRRSFLHERPWT